MNNYFNGATITMLVDDTRNYKLDCYTAGGEGASQEGPLRVALRLIR